LTRARKLETWLKMKTTIDLPAPLVRQMKMRAAREGRKLKDVAAEIFRAGLETPIKHDRTDTSSSYDQSLEVPLFACETSKAKAPAMTVEELLRLEQTALLEEDSIRAGRTL